MTERMKPKPVVKLIVPTVRPTRIVYDDPETAAYAGEGDDDEAPDRQDE